MSDAARQAGHPVRFEWGPVGGAAVAEGADVVVVVDVLTFTTALDVAVGRGAVVVPHPLDGHDLDAAAAQAGAVLARPSGRPAGDGPSASPAALRSLRQLPDRLLLPSPDGSALAHDLAGVATTVVGAGLRNARAVADWLAREHDAEDATVAVVAAGARWPDGSLRPALEDLWGAGAVLAALEDHDWPGLSPEAVHAADAHRLVAGRERSHLLACAGGRELVADGRADDVEVAAEVGVSTVVPLLSDRGFVPAP